MICLIYYEENNVMVFFWFGKKKAKPVLQKGEMEYDSISRKITIFDESNNQAVMSLSEIDKGVLDKGFNIDANMSSQIQHFLSDSFKGVISIPNSTIEVVFKPEIMDGLQNGNFVLQTTKNGEKLADAINKSGKFVGKGRIVETGKVKQLCGGGYQLLSIAVAQSHLADINTRLDRIEKSCNEIKEYFERNELSNIEGDINYLKKLFNDLNNKRDFTLSLERSNHIESIINRLYKYSAQIINDFDSCIENINNQKNIDYFGTGNTYNELNTKIDKVNRIIKRKSYIIQLIILLQYIVAIIDPFQKKYTQFNDLLFEKKWDDLSDSFIACVRETVEKLIQATCNDKDVLTVRRANLNNQAKSLKNQIDILKHDSKFALLTLKHSLAKLTNLDGNLRYYLSFDESGQIKQAGTAYRSDLIY